MRRVLDRCGRRRGRRDRLRERSGHERCIDKLEFVSVDFTARLRLYLQLHLNDSSSQRSSQTAHIDLPSLFLRMKQCPSTHFVSSLSRTGCTIMFGMMVLAAKVLWAYTLGAYVEAV